MTGYYLMKVRKILETSAPGLGQKIKSARENDKRSLLQICQEVGMTPTNWYKIEAEETKYLPLETLVAIEEVLKVDFGVTFPD